MKITIIRQCSDYNNPYIRVFDGYLSPEERERWAHTRGSELFGIDDYRIKLDINKIIISSKFACASETYDVKFKENMSRTVVIYSGGIDSTALLCMMGKESTKENPVFTLSVREHFRGNKLQFLAQTRARRKYLAWAKKQGHHIIADDLSIMGNHHGKFSDYNSLTQAYHWVNILSPYFNSGDNVYWGWKGSEVKTYIVNYLNHYNDLVKESLNWNKINHHFPFENCWGVSKAKEIIGNNRIPQECIYNCNHPVVNRKQILSCNDCFKCGNMNFVYGAD